MPGYKMEYTDEEKYKVFIYVDVDENGYITNAITGKNIIPDRAYQFFFLEDAYIADSIRNYKVIIEAFTPKLQAIDTDLENRLKENYYAESN